MGRSNVRIVSTLVDFSSLSIHQHLLKSAPAPRRVFTLLGGTFDELDKPLAFLQYGLPEVQQGDLLVLDVCTPAAPGELSESLCARDPWLRDQARGLHRMARRRLRLAHRARQVGRLDRWIR